VVHVLAGRCWAGRRAGAFGGCPRDGRSTGGASDHAWSRGVNEPAGGSPLAGASGPSHGVDPLALSALGSRMALTEQSGHAPAVDVSARRIGQLSPAACRRLQPPCVFAVRSALETHSSRGATYHDDHSTPQGRWSDRRVWFGRRFGVGVCLGYWGGSLGFADVCRRNHELLSRCRRGRCCLPGRCRPSLVPRKLSRSRRRAVYLWLQRQSCMQGQS